MSPCGKEECKPASESEHRRLLALEQATDGGGYETD